MRADQYRNTEEEEHESNTEMKRVDHVELICGQVLDAKPRVGTRILRVFHDVESVGERSGERKRIIGGKKKKRKIHENHPFKKKK